MASKSSVTCLKSHFYDVNITNGKTTKYLQLLVFFREVLLIRSIKCELLTKSIPRSHLNFRDESNEPNYVIIR
jgi:hypothetical protein